MTHDGTAEWLAGLEEWEKLKDQTPMPCSICGKPTRHTYFIGAPCCFDDGTNQCKRRLAEQKGFE